MTDTLTLEDHEGREWRAHIRNLRESARRLAQRYCETVAPLDAKLAAIDAELYDEAAKSVYPDFADPPAVPTPMPPMDDNFYCFKSSRAPRVYTKPMTPTKLERQERAVRDFAAACAQERGESIQPVQWDAMVSAVETLDRSKPKLKSCAHCGKMFTPRDGRTLVCSHMCAAKYQRSLLVSPEPRPWLLSGGYMSYTGKDEAVIDEVRDHNLRIEATARAKGTMPTSAPLTPDDIRDRGRRTFPVLSEWCPSCHMLKEACICS